MNKKELSYNSRLFFFYFYYNKKGPIFLIRPFLLPCQGTQFYIIFYIMSTINAISIRTFSFILHFLQQKNTST